MVPTRFAQMMAKRFDLQIRPPPFPSPTMRLHLGTLKARTTDAGLPWLKHALLRSMMQVVADYPAAPG
jgi:hypothetical protein